MVSRVSDYLALFTPLFSIRFDCTCYRNVGILDDSRGVIVDLDRSSTTYHNRVAILPLMK